MEKTCNICQETKSLEEFSKNSTNKDGKANFCKVCKTKKDKIYRENNKEKVRESAKNWYIENAEKAKQYAANWRLQNKEHKKEYNKKWKINNKEKIKQYSENSKERKKEYDKNYKDIILKRKYGISLKQYETMLDEQNGVCYICSDNDSVKLAVDHDHRTGKIRKLLCKKCNVAIGLLKEDLNIIENVLKYIKHFS